jgi:hypothetical protein
VTASDVPLVPSVSVALATHNGVRFVEEQLRSILSQDPAPMEIVVSDDASTDGTVETVESVFAHMVDSATPAATRLIVIRNVVPLGVTANFEQACIRCAGELIALCDQDDVWESGRLRLFTDLFAHNPELLLANSDATLIDESDTVIGASLLATIRATQWEKQALANGSAFDALIRRNLVTGATAVFRRELLARALPFERAWLHDEWLAIIGAATGRLGFIDKPLTRYRQHASNQIGASRFTLARGVGRLRAGRADRNARLLSQAITLVERLEVMQRPLHPGVIETANAKLRHERFRSALPARRIARVIPVLRVFARGDYRRYSRGPADALRDVVQPF